MRIVRNVVLAATLGLAVLQMQACTSTPTMQSTGEVIDDGVITARVKTALYADPVVKGTQVEVETFRGVVQLSGFVDNQDQASRAVRLAAEVRGVKSVKNDMRLKPRV